MFWAFVRFYLTLMSNFLLPHTYWQELVIDAQHPHYRRFGNRYKKKRSIVKSCWIGAGLLALVFPAPHITVFLSLLTTFISFSILDETE